VNRLSFYYAMKGFIISPIEYVKESFEESDYHETRSSQGKDEKE